MQSGGGPLQGGSSSHGRGTAASASASPSSSLSAAFDLQQQQQQQQQTLRQVMQQQFLRRAEGNGAHLVYQAGNVHGMVGGANMPGGAGPVQLPQQAKKFIDLGQHHGSSVAEQGHSRNQDVEQQMIYPFQQAYLQYAFQAAQNKSNLGMQFQQQMKPGLFSLSKDQEMQMANMRTQEFMSQQAVNQSHASSSSKPSSPVAQGDRWVDQSQRPVPDQRIGLKSNQTTLLGQTIQTASMPSLQPSPQNVMDMANNPIAMAARIQTLQALALEHNIDLTNPANANVIAQLLPLVQSRMVTQQKANENNGMQSSSFAKLVASSQVGNESSPCSNSSSDSSSMQARQTVLPSSLGVASGSTLVNNSSNIPLQHFSMHGRENHLPPTQPALHGNGIPFIHSAQSSGNQGNENSLLAKSSATAPEVSQAQNARKLHPQSATPSDDVDVVNPSTSLSGSSAQTRQLQVGFTKQQLHVLKAQILAFRRLKKGEGTLPRELLQAIAPPSLDLQKESVHSPSIAASKDKSAEEIFDELARTVVSTEKGPNISKPAVGARLLKEDGLGDDRRIASIFDMQSSVVTIKEPRFILPSRNEEQQSQGSLGKSHQKIEAGNLKTPMRSDIAANKGKEIVTESSVSDSIQAKKLMQPIHADQTKDTSSTQKYHGPLFDFPIFTRKHDTLGASTMNSNNSLTLAYGIKDLFANDGVEICNSKRAEKIKKIDKLLSVNLERKRIRPDLAILLQIESKKLHLAEFQAHMRDEIEQQQEEIMTMPERLYRKFVRLCERQRRELTRQSLANRKAIRERQLKSIFHWRKKLFEGHWANRDARTARNRGVHKYHEKMLREFSKRNDNRDKRMEALKNNDVERYREMLFEQQSNNSGEAAKKYAVVSAFLSETEKYLHKLGCKITSAKNMQEAEEEADRAVSAARARGFSDEEVKLAAACAKEEVMIRNRFSEMNAPREGSSANKYYNLAHAVNERITRQPAMLRAGKLRDYQLVGLQWMLSLYNNKLNGILADEMGLGKTVQVMALIAYLMENKGNYGPHLIIVPNAVLVNWKSEFHNWLPTVSCIYYVGGKDQRSKLFSQEVLALKFNVLVTTYEFVMYDRSKLSKVEWKYIIIDEAQRMKDRESVLARDLDKYRCQRRLLLTGTPLQNDLKELWSLLNLLLPEVFDNRKVFHDWFSQPFQREGPVRNAEDDWLETEKKVIIIHRLHQILEPFMLRRRVEDVEGSLPPKVSIVLRCRMSAIQSAIYDWIKSTGTIRVDPDDEQRKVRRNPNYLPRTYKPLYNRCMELRKVCNNPLLNYPYFSDLSKDFLVRSCGKLWILDRILMKLQRTGHRVLLFSTMTKLLDIMEEYLQWRGLVFRRIDGMTSLEDRESAIVDFNSPDTDCFIFLLSIRAAGRGLNLQTADTVIIYDPDPNPKNEEQAIARAHRIGQTREVKVIYLEAVVSKISSHEKEDEFRTGGMIDSDDDDLVGKDRYMGSIESLIRNNIQQYKIDMADEVINAGRFDQRTTHEERRTTLETLLRDEERYQETVHDVPSLREVNRMIARSEEEVEIFDQMDEELDWAEDMTQYDQVPDWLRASTEEVNDAIAELSKKPSKRGLYGGSVGKDSNEVAADTERKRGRPRGKVPVYTEVDAENEECSDASSEDRNGYFVHEEEGVAGESEDYESTEAPHVHKDQSDEDCYADKDERQGAVQSIRKANIVGEAGSSGSSSHSGRLMLVASSSVSSQKFGSLSALDSRSNSQSRKLAGELEGEIAASGDSLVDQLQSGSWIQEREEGEDEQVLQPKIKRKRSIRLRPRQTLERSEERHSDKSSLRRIYLSQLPIKGDHKHKSLARDDHAQKVLGESSSVKSEKGGSAVKNKQKSLSSKKNASNVKVSMKSGEVNYGSASEYSIGPPRETMESKVVKGHTGSSKKMPDVIQRKCKTVISKLQRRIDSEGHQIVPLLTVLWRKIESSGGVVGAGDNILDLKRIHLRVDKSEYSGVMELISDVQLLLKFSMHYYGFSYEVRSESRKVHDLFFDILCIAFSDMDFREARSSLSFSALGSGPAKGPSSRQMPTGHIKCQKSIKDVAPDSGPRLKAQTSVSIHAEGSKVWSSAAPQKDMRLGSNSRDVCMANEACPVTHPGELVICKRKRKDREKPSSAKPGNRLSGPLSPTGVGGSIRSPSAISGVKEMGLRPASPQTGYNSSGSVGWANPVKKMRTDSGRHRPIHL